MHYSDGLRQLEHKAGLMKKMIGLSENELFEKTRGWRDGSVSKSSYCLLFLPRNQVQYSAPTLSSSQLPVSPIPGGLMPSAGRHKHLQSRAHTAPQMHAYNL